ncbi:hypothetical protein SAMN04487820_11121 [Actinopolyspora mzabensis]|uniref:Uncharacterized protein n=1 Tax=Actinopolyspora mzabensis TaxID=995066 RepID=A0A1G9DYZ7_ACTMZ|nr:hypothetical protein [Actinopolyspora mzabensis]SDK69095.1 hypothetical protein SAMN04487820_11121 [Actinopolyspora mzabensis]
MQVRTDDEIYRVDAVWLGPPKATFPWRARYVAWGVGILVFLLVLAAERRMNIGFGFFSTAWAVVITIALTRLICSRISHERPLSAVMVMWLRELTAPRRSVRGRGGAASAAAVRVSSRRPRPARSKQSGRGKRSARRKRASAGSAPAGPARQGEATRPAREVRTPRDRSGSAGRASPPNSRVRSKEVRGVRSRARS